MDEPGASGLNLTQSSGKSASIAGDLTTDNAGRFADLLRGINPDPSGMIEIDLSEIEIDGGAAMAAAVSALRQLSCRASKLVLVGAPQMLCHNLYRIGLLDDKIELLDMRHDEPAAF